MGIYIKGMEMPEGTQTKVVVLLGKIARVNGKDYPVISVPPHGRLVDADAMEKTMSDTVQGDIRGYPYSDTLWDTAFRWIDNQPTIIPAEEGELDGSL